jgi:uncharacterized protein YkwD
MQEHQHLRPKGRLHKLLAHSVLACAMTLAQACPETPEAMLAQINTLRAQGGACGARGDFAAAGSVQWSATLEAMAQQHARELASMGELRHRNAAGQALAERATAVGYRYRHIGENLALGQSTLTSVLHAWTASATHCATLFGAAPTEAALACAHTKDGRAVWVMVMARPRA